MTPGRSKMPSLGHAAMNQSSGTGAQKPMDSDYSAPESVPYDCGRLLAHLDLIRRSMDGDSTIATTCFQTAAAMPAVALGSLLAMSWRDLNSIRRQLGHRDEGVWLEQRLSAILDDLGAFFPDELDRRQQGVFAIGFYQERATTRAMGSVPRRAQPIAAHDLVLRELTGDPTGAVPDDL